MKSDDCNFQNFLLSDDDDDQPNYITKKKRRYCDKSN